MSIPSFSAWQVRRTARAVIAVCAGLTIHSAALADPAVNNPKQPETSGAASWQGRNRFYFSAGWMWKETGGVHFASGSRSPEFSLPMLFGADRESHPPIGTTGEVADRFYRDGSVRMDEGTALDGTTSAWSYRDASQVVGDSLQFHAGGERRSFDSGGSIRPAKDHELDGGGGAPVLEVGWERELSPTWSWGARLQWSFLDLDGEHSQSNFSAWQRGRDSFHDFTDTYDLQGVTVPEAPYDGGGLGFGPLIDNRPTSRQRIESQTGGAEAHFFNRIHQSFEIKLHTVSLGPVVTGQVGPIGIQGGVGIALNLVDWEAQQQETLYLRRTGQLTQTYRRWTHQRHETEVLPGFFLQGGLTWEVTPRIFVNGFGRYDWSEELEERVGPSTLSFDPGGWSAGLLLGMKF